MANVTLPGQYPYDKYVGAQWLANKYAPDWFQSVGRNIADPNQFYRALAQQMYTVTPQLNSTDYNTWLSHYQWLTGTAPSTGVNRMPTGFTPEGFNPQPVQNPWGSESGGLPWDTGGQFQIPFPTLGSNPNVWQGLSDQQVQRALAYYSAMQPYVELAESARRWQADSDWAKKEDAYGTTGRAQLPRGGYLRRY